MRSALLLPADVTALTAFRCLPDGTGRQYTITTFTPDPWLACNHLLRMAAACGYVNQGPYAPGYAVLDALNADDEIVTDYNIPTAAAFRWWYRKLGLRIDNLDDSATVS